MASAGVERPEQDAFRIAPGDGDDGLLSALGPHRPQWREQAQERLILNQHNRPRWQALQAPNNGPFF
jgi:hypothetical protein